MVETVIINGSNYEFEIFLVNASESSNMQIVPISKSSIKYLEITNDLINIGYVGKVVFTNYYGILEKLQLLTSYSEAPYMYLRLKNLDFQSTKSNHDDIYLTASLQTGQEVNLNAIDGSLAYNFEELCISKLKRTRVSFLKNNSGTLFDTTAPTIDSGDLLLDSLTPADHIKNYFINGVADAEIDGTILTNEVKIDGSSNLIREQVSKITNISNPDSYYTIIERLYPYVSFQTKLEGWYSPGIINLVNDEKTNKRKLVISSLLEGMQTFFDLIKTNPTSKDIKNYLTERFNVAQTGDSPYFSDNYIDKYELKRVNYDDVFEKKWATIELVSEDPCSNDLYVIKYDQLRAAFENICTKPFASNLPDRKNDVEMDKIKRLQYARPNIDPTLAQVYGINKVFKSFVFDNVAVTFRVKGQPYRKPGKFITIKTDNVDINNKKNKNIAEINGYWYIVSVSHVFENDVYFNDFICVKIYNPFGEISAAPTTPTSNIPTATTTTPTTQPSGINSGTGGTIEGPGNVEFVEPDLPEGDGTLDDDLGVLPPLPESDSNLGPAPFIDGKPNPEFENNQNIPQLEQ